MRQSFGSILFAAIISGQVMIAAAAPTVTINALDVGAAAGGSLDLGVASVLVPDANGCGVDVTFEGAGSADTGVRANHLFLGQTSGGTYTLGVVSDSSDPNSPASSNGLLLGNAQQAETLTIAFGVPVIVKQLTLVDWGANDTTDGPFQISGFATDPNLTAATGNSGQYSVSFAGDVVSITHVGGTYDEAPVFDLKADVAVTQLVLQAAPTGGGAQGIGFHQLVYKVAPSSTPSSWTFVSSPDFFNSDIGDLSGCADTNLVNCSHGLPAAAGWPSVSKGRNSLTPAMDAAYDALVAQMASYNPECFVVAGDLINGRWFNNTTINMFAPGGTRAEAIFAGAEIYYGWMQHLFERNGICKIVAAIGDHDVGDNDWGRNSAKANHVDTMREAFDIGMVAPLCVPNQINGADSRPFGTPYAWGSYGYQVHNVLFVSVDVFRQDDPGTNIHTIHGTVSPDVAGAHLTWLDNLLTAADSDPSIDHVIVQAHPPVFPGTRKRSSSGMMLVDRMDSAFWNVLRAHSHQMGGKVRLYFGGEVHTVTATKDEESDVVQLVHGNPPLGDTSNFIVATVQSDRIEIDLYGVQMSNDNSQTRWQVSKTSGQNGNMAVTGFSYDGRMVIDVSGPKTQFENEGWLEFVDYNGLLIHFALDEATGVPPYDNTGSMGNINYAGLQRGAPALVSGKLGNARRFDGVDDYIESGMAPITEGERRSISAWIRTSSLDSFLTIASYGKDKGFAGRFNFRVSAGVLELNIKNGVTAVASSAPPVNDGQWHHVAVVLPQARNNLLGDVIFYVDGVAYPATTGSPNTWIVTFPGTNNFLIGVAHAESWGFFNGEIDDVGLWGAGLNLGRIRALKNTADTDGLEYNSLQTSELFDAFDGGMSQVFVSGRTWVTESGLGGAAGDVSALGQGRFSLSLDEAGNGYRSLHVGDATGDGGVDLFDVAVAQRNTEISSNATPADGDHDGDGDVDISDVFLLLELLGAGL